MSGLPWFPSLKPTQEGGTKPPSQKGTKPVAFPEPAANMGVMLLRHGKTCLMLHVSRACLKLVFFLFPFKSTPNGPSSKTEMHPYGWLVFFGVGIPLLGRFTGTPQVKTVAHVGPKTENPV